MFRDIMDFIYTNKNASLDNFTKLKAICDMFFQVIEVATDDFVEERKSACVDVVLDLLITPDNYLRTSACKVFETLIRKCRKQNLIGEIIPQTLAELESLDESAENYDDYLKFFDEMVRLNLDNHLIYLGKLLFAAPLNQQKLDIITNNADSFGPLFYEKGFFNKMIDFMLDELFVVEYSESNRSSILYCINNISIHIKHKNLSQFFMRIKLLTDPQNLKDNQEMIYAGLDILAYFFQNTNKDITTFVYETLSSIDSYLNLDDSKIIDRVNKIYKAVLTGLDHEQSFNTIKVVNQIIEDIL